MNLRKFHYNADGKETGEHSCNIYVLAHGKEFEESNVHNFNRPLRE
jgi:hypothetical protein